MLVVLLHDCVLLPQTAGSLTYLGAMFIVLLAPLFAVMWTRLDRRGLDPSKPTEVRTRPAVRGPEFPAAGRGPRSTPAPAAQLASVWWLVLAYLLLELGEMCL